MKIKRAAMLGAACGAIGVWLAAATTGVRSPAQMIAPKAAAIDKKGEALAAEIQRLHERLRPSDSPLQNRDLFQYAGSRAVSSSAAPARLAPIDVPPATQPAAPAFKLVGIAEDEGANGLVRTAIVSGSGELMFVKEGDAVAPGYRVAKISSDAVELTDMGSGSSLLLVLK